MPLHWIAERNKGLCKCLARKSVTKNQVNPINCALCSLLNNLEPQWFDTANNNSPQPDIQQHPQNRVSIQNYKLVLNSNTC